MKKNKISLIAIFIFSVSAAALGNNRVELINKTGQHHSAALTIAAFFYCTLNRWPSGMQEIQDFREKHMSDYRVGLDWDWLKSKKVSYQYKKSYSLTSRTWDGKNEIIFKSKQLAPTCKDGKIKKLNGNSVSLE